MDQHTETLIIEVARRGPSGDYTGAAAVTALQGDMADLEAFIAALGLDDLSGVTITSPASGEVLTYNGTAWVNATPTSGVQISEGGVAVVPSAALLDFSAGPFDVQYISDTYAVIQMKYGGSGVAGTVSRSDHRHNAVALTRAPIEPGGYLSSGTRPMGAVSFALDPGIVYHIIARLKVQMRGADPGACYYRQTISIAGDARTSPAGAGGFWCVQGVPDRTEWVHAARITGTGQSITVTASTSYHSGGGFNTDYGELEIEIYPSR